MSDERGPGNRRQTKRSRAWGMVPRDWDETKLEPCRTRHVGAWRMTRESCAWGSVANAGESPD